MKTVLTNSLEIFKSNIYFPTSIGMVSNNAYLSIVATNRCNRNYPYCINSETDHRLSAPIDKSVRNIKRLVEEYKVKEAIILGGEPLLHPDILKFIKELRTKTGLEMLRLTTNGIYLNQHKDIIPALVDNTFGIQGINISCHNGYEFMTYNELEEICHLIKKANPKIKIRINSNIWKDNLDNLFALLHHINLVSEFADEIRVSNIIPKDGFSVNPINKAKNLVLPTIEYESLFTRLIEHYSNLTIFENPKTLGFVKYFLIPTKVPIIVNWNIGSTVSEQVCENDIVNRQINTFKCLVSGNISLSWNEDNTIVK